MVISIHQSLNTGSDGIVHLGVDIRRIQVLLAGACHRDYGLPFDLQSPFARQGS